jgi:hypothetical protein
MTPSELLETQVTGTPATQARVERVEELPDDLLREATHRLGLLAAVWAGLFVIGIVMNDVLKPLLHLPVQEMIPWGRPGDTIAVLTIAATASLCWYTRRLTCNPRLALDLALVYEVLLAFGIGLLNQWEPHRVLAGRLSWMCVLVLLFPMILPNTPRKTLIASLIAASMDPIGILIGHWRGLAVPSLSVIVWNYTPNYVCAVIAVIPSKIMVHLGRQVRRARELGSYRLVELIGRGGMGEVWRATHRMLARPAAIKLIKPEILGNPGTAGSAAVVQRFRREAEAASFLQSPHTIRLYDFGETRAGTFYFVMELLDGLDLETLVRQHGPIPPERVIHVLRHLCHSLAEAHDRGMIHRDVKPANIFLCRLGREYDFVKVLDFGLVKFDQDESIMDTIKAASEVTTGTPAYMAPEMANGESVDRRADLYAVGCVAYWLLTGHLVFEAESALRMLIQHIQAQPVPPSQRGAQAVPPALERLVLRCLEKDPARRPSNADEIVAELDRVELDGAWDQQRAREWWESHIAAPAAVPSLTERPLLAVRT